MTQPERREDEKDGTDDESLPSTSNAPAPPTPPAHMTADEGSI